ncbi:hypothetical protein PQJ75_08490 [Rhodoplanes sp. TEM]|uniref:Uncharacterized protein n=1 Tax=Rhodoplanes tepidamans TaxID=200616 RepID=A0ABT5JAS3_RHOTP|nr:MULTISPECIES: hypothetical protein [Rhodoplanes]MDC7786759.1 hypothetical protein [Rhodoplanes tepidamans]MDC7983765.1 hypothetical protein [Rhodoplanes sp. TEM]MDQ0358196.1 hypothetical protein [Rhodoplanes tepidamans]
MLRRDATCLIAAGLLGLAVGPAAAQAPQPPVTPDRPAAGTPSPPASRLDCPPGVDPGRAPALGDQGAAGGGRGGSAGTTGAGDSLSGQLSHSRGVVCPPAGTDPGMVEPPPAGGALKVIPPPGTPGGEPAPVPK